MSNVSGFFAVTKRGEKNLKSKNELPYNNCVSHQIRKYNELRLEKKKKDNALLILLYIVTGKRHNRLTNTRVFVSGYPEAKPYIHIYLRVHYIRIYVVYMYECVFFFFSSVRCRWILRSIKTSEEGYAYDVHF